MRILVTGCCGFIGSHIYNKLKENGHAVLGIDDLSGGDIHNVKDHKDVMTFSLEDPHGVEFDVPKIEEVVMMFKPEVCFHLAASAREIGSLFEPLCSTKKNLWAYMNLLNALIKNDFKKMILFSSMAVYGDQTPPFEEGLIGRPEDVYGINKMAMEDCTISLSEIHDFNLTILRPHNVFGENQSLRDKYRNVIAIWMNKIMRGEAVTIFGDGEQRRALSYIDFSLPCYIRCLTEASQEVVNIGGIKDHSINELAEMTIGAMVLMGWKEPDIKYFPPRPMEVKNAWTTHEKSVDLLGYEETMLIESCILKMADWATKKGPQEWTFDKLELYNDKAPEAWK